MAVEELKRYTLMGIRLFFQTKREEKEGGDKHRKLGGWGQ